MGHRLIRMFFILVLLLGVGLLLYPVAANVAFQLGAYNAVSSYNDSLLRYSDDDLKRMWDEAYAYNEELGNPEVRDPFGYEEIESPLDRYFQTLNPDGTGMMGYVEVPAANIRLPIYHGTSDEVLDQGAGHIATSAFPIDGTSIHPIITGHTGLSGKLLFTNLSLVRQGDIVRVVVLDKTFSYQVTSVDVIEPDDTSLLQPVAGVNRLTLFTCTPYGINSHRLLVTGVPVVEEGTGEGGVPLALLWVVLGLLAALAVAFVAVAVARHRRRLAATYAMKKRGGHAGALKHGGKAPSFSTRGYSIAMVGLAIGMAVLAWIALGVGMYTGFVPFFDLGYGWLEAFRAAA